MTNMEITFMDEVIAVIPFSVGKKDIERIGGYEALLNEDIGRIHNETIKIKESNVEKRDDNEGDSVEIFIDDRSVEEILADLNSLIGQRLLKHIYNYLMIYSLSLNLDFCYISCYNLIYYIQFFLFQNF